MEINPQDAYAWCQKGIAFNNLGRCDEAIQAYDRTIEIDPQYAMPGTIRAMPLIIWVDMMKRSKLMIKPHR